MNISNIRSRAGLVALVFALIVSLVSAVPIPATESRLSSNFKLSPGTNLNPSLNGQDHAIQLDTTRISEVSLGGRMSTLPAATRALARRQETSTDMDDQLLVRRSIWDKIKHAFQSFGRKVKSGFQKAGAAIKHGFQKFGEKVKSGFQKFGAKVKSGFQKAGAAIKSGFQKFGAKVKSGFQTAGRAIKSGFQKAGAAIKTGFQKVGKGIVYAAKKVGKFIKTTGLKIIKFGTKIVQVAEQAIGKVVSFIPVIGKPLGKALEGASKVWGVVSDHIPVKLSGKLEKGVKVMDHIHDALDFVPRRRDLSEKEAFQQRDISDAYYFEERDDIALENREESYFVDIYERDIYERYDLDY